MKSYAAPIAVSAVVFITLLQPCPAPIITTLAIAGTGAALFGAGAGVGAWAAGHGASSVKPTVIYKAPGESSDHVAPIDPNLTSREDLTPFERCSYDGLHTAQSLEFPANGSIIVADLPPSCMDWFQHYNLHPDIEELNEAHGTISTLNASAVELANLPGYVMAYVESSLLNGTKDGAEDKVVSRARRALVAAEGFTA